jgi:hypothetical protein
LYPRLFSKVSVMATVRVDSEVGAGSLPGIVIAYKSDATIIYGLYYNKNTNKITFAVKGTSINLSTDIDIELGREYHIVATYDGSIAYLYVDGERQATTDSASFTIDYDDFQSFSIGKYYSNSHLLNGKISDVKIFDRTLSAEDVANYYDNSMFKYEDDILVELPMTEEYHSRFYAKNKHSIGVPKLDNLPAALNINNQTVLPSARYRGNDATPTSWPAWEYGETLSITGVGSDPIVGSEAPFLGRDDTSVKGNADKYYRNGSTQISIINTNDFVVEYVVKGPSSGNQVTIASNWFLNIGMSVQFLTSGQANVYWRQVADGVDLTVGSTSTEIVANAYHHIIFFADRSGAATMYVNGELTSTVDISSFDGTSLFNTNPYFALIGRYDNAQVFDSNITYYSHWIASDMINPSERESVAKQRYNQLFQGSNGKLGNFAESYMPTKLDHKRGYKFDGSNDRITFNDLGYSGDWSITICFKKDLDSALNRYLVGFLNTIDVEAGILIYGGTEDLRFYDAASAFSSAKSLESGKIHTLTMTYKSSNDEVVYYLNGNLLQTFSSGYSFDLRSIFIGSRFGTGNFEGDVYEFEIHKKILSPIQIRDLHSKMLRRINRNN